MRLMAKSGRWGQGSRKSQGKSIDDIELDGRAKLGVCLGERGAQLVMHDWSEDEKKAWSVIYTNPFAMKPVVTDPVELARWTAY
jgi:hypothetical protein